MTKTLNQQRIQENFLNMTKAIYEKLTANIILNDEWLKAFPVRLGIRQGCLLLPILFNIVLEVLARAIRQENDIKVIQIEKEVKLSPFTGDMILCLEKPLKSTKEC